MMCYDICMSDIRACVCVHDMCYDTRNMCDVHDSMHVIEREMVYCLDFVYRYDCDSYSFDRGSDARASHNHESLRTGAHGFQLNIGSLPCSLHELFSTSTESGVVLAFIDPYMYMYDEFVYHGMCSVCVEEHTTLSLLKFSMRFGQVGATVGKMRVVLRFGVMKVLISLLAHS